MPLHILTDPKASGTNRSLQARQAELRVQGIDAEIVTGNACTTPYLVDCIQQQAKAGARYFLGDNCTRDQINAVQNIELPEQFTVYLVPQA